MIVNHWLANRAWIALSIGLIALTASCGGDEQLVASDQNPVEFQTFDVRAGLRNALSTAITHQISATDAGGTTTVRITIDPKGEVTLADGSAVNATETTNQTTSPSGAVTESKTVTYWNEDPANNDGVRVVSVETASVNRVLSVTSTENLPGPVLINTTGAFYDGLVTENAVRVGSASVNWALQANDVRTAWACTIARTTFSSSVFSDCHLINTVGELQGRYRSIVAEGSSLVVFQ